MLLGNPQSVQFRLNILPGAPVAKVLRMPMARLTSTSSRSALVLCLLCLSFILCLCGVVCGQDLNKLVPRNGVSLVSRMTEPGTGEPASPSANNSGDTPLDATSDCSAAQRLNKWCERCCTSMSDGYKDNVEKNIGDRAHSELNGVHEYGDMPPEVMLACKALLYLSGCRERCCASVSDGYKDNVKKNIGDRAHSELNNVHEGDTSPDVTQGRTTEPSTVKPTNALTNNCGDTLPSPMQDCNAMQRLVEWYERCYAYYRFDNYRAIVTKITEGDTHSELSDVCETEDTSSDSTQYCGTVQRLDEWCEPMDTDQGGPQHPAVSTKQEPPRAFSSITQKSTMDADQGSRRHPAVSTKQEPPRAFSGITQEPTVGADQGSRRHPTVSTKQEPPRAFSGITQKPTVDADQGSRRHPAVGIKQEPRLAPCIATQSPPADACDWFLTPRNVAAGRDNWTRIVSAGQRISHRPAVSVNQEGPRASSNITRVPRLP